ncbi:hypothetical protein CANCADRAFT_123193 [Tortispora caseinolytica NRRL Y-17796]|uniref:Uncharacterized protein n=1 Tax=Tortispora caseinolytica NRRL Y-17796 TaxID=767744 RepID=A0A1E4THY5_9ASCO|nr:hypothetical protein CANCADRAFT_123193 [Tortispora caseinolytica NRRL Y-17796]
MTDSVECIDYIPDSMDEGSVSLDEIQYLTVPNTPWWEDERDFIATYCVKNEIENSYIDDSFSDDSSVYLSLPSPPDMVFESTAETATIPSSVPAERGLGEMLEQGYVSCSEASGYMSEDGGL